MYDVFFSYSHKDKEFVHRLAKRFQEDGIKTFVDEWSIPWGASIPHQLEAAMDESKHIMLVLSPDYLSSGWGRIERYAGMYDDPDGVLGKLLPIVVSEVEIPRLLRPIRYLDCRIPEALDELYPEMVRYLIRDKESPVDPDEQVFQRLAERNGSSYESVSLEYRIRSDGSASLQRRVVVLAVERTEELTIRAISKHKESSPSKEYVPIKVSSPSKEYVPIVESISSVNRENDLANSLFAREIAVRMRIVPPLLPGQSFSYETKEVLNQPIHHRFSAVDVMYSDRAMDEVFGWYEFFGWHITEPTKHLAMDVVFPESWKFASFEGEVLGPSFGILRASRNLRESQRISFEGRMRYGLQILHLEASFPMQGFTYCLRWLPIDGST